MMVRAAVDDVRFLSYVHHRIMEKLNEQLYANLLFVVHCIVDGSVSVIRGLQIGHLFLLFPDSIKAKGNAPEEEIFSVIYVPSRKMGCVIGKRGASILSIKKSCKCSS